MDQSLQTVFHTLEMQNPQPDKLHQWMLEQQDANMGLQRQQHEREMLLQVAQESQTSIQEQMDKHEHLGSIKVDHLFSQYAQFDWFKKAETSEKLKQDQLYSSVTETISTAVASSLEKVVQHEIRQHVLPEIQLVKEQLHQMTQKLAAATDSLLKDNDGKMVHSQENMDAIEMAAGNAISSSVQMAYTEPIEIPSFKRATQAMVHQVNDIFQTETREYVKHLDAQLDQVREKHLEASNPIVSELRILTDSFQTSAEKMQRRVLATVQTQLMSELQSSMSGMQKMIVGYVRDAVQEEVSIALKEQHSSISKSILDAMRSGAINPVQVTPDPQLKRSEILQLLEQGQLNTAFYVALSTTMMDMVIYICENVDICQVFEQTPCPLHQALLLSLIQQLSVDLELNTKLKYKFITEAVVSLDKSDPITQEHVTGIICGLIEKVNAFIRKHPNHKMTRLFKKLLMMAENFVIRA
ncbi:hypothetical protein CHS0354_042955 [Potamilus streckersoni]|uniref:Enhancer of mRNA-decapping protein 4 C-terminal domain-containing protein n=1 Tax=Potamilus streckersoni TaxID=2493646 RepID=A0AAE0W6I1_9BIVA|nr:hypothetical protein CHS0354_042955 [Potamilus streckersoni]